MCTITPEEALAIAKENEECKKIKLAPNQFFTGVFINHKDTVVEKISETNFVQINRNIGIMLEITATIANGEFVWQYRVFANDDFRELATTKTNHTQEIVSLFNQIYIKIAESLKNSPR